MSRNAAFCRIYRAEPFNCGGRNIVRLAVLFYFMGRGCDFVGIAVPVDVVRNVVSVKVVIVVDRDGEALALVSGFHLERGAVRVLFYLFGSCGAVLPRDAHAVKAVAGRGREHADKSCGGVFSRSYGDGFAQCLICFTVQFWKPEVYGNDYLGVAEFSHNAYVFRRHKIFGKVGHEFAVYPPALEHLAFGRSGLRLAAHIYAQASVRARVVCDVGLSFYGYGEDIYLLRPAADERYLSSDLRYEGAVQSRDRRLRSFQLPAAERVSFGSRGRIERYSAVVYIVFLGVGVFPFGRGRHFFGIVYVILNSEDDRVEHGVKHHRPSACTEKRGVINGEFSVAVIYGYLLSVKFKSAERSAFFVRLYNAQRRGYIGICVLTENDGRYNAGSCGKAALVTVCNVVRAIIPAFRISHIV